MSRLTQNKNGSLSYETGDTNGDFTVLIDTIISKKMTPIYWIIGITMVTMLSIFVSISLPLQSKLMEVSLIQQTKLGSETADKTYLKKWDYYQIEEDEHRVMKEILKNPIQTDYLIDIINDNMTKQLGFKLTERSTSK